MDYVNENRAVIDTANPKSSVKKEVWDKVRYLGPVPGGVGLMTIAMLMENTLESARMKLRSYDK